jgi:hypothetical protein
MVQTQPHRQALTSNRSVEHSAEGHAVDRHRLHAKADDSASTLIHHDQNPMGFELDGLNPEQIQAPQAVFGLPFTPPTLANSGSSELGDSTSK